MTLVQTRQITFAGLGRAFACASCCQAAWAMTLLAAGLPREFVLALLLVSQCRGLSCHAASFDAVELFAGDRSVTRALRRPCRMGWRHVWPSLSDRALLATPLVHVLQAGPCALAPSPHISWTGPCGGTRWLWISASTPTFATSIHRLGSCPAPSFWMAAREHLQVTACLQTAACAAFLCG